MLSPSAAGPEFNAPRRSNWMRPIPTKKEVMMMTLRMTVRCPR